MKVNIEDIKLLILNFLYKNSPEGFKLSNILDLGFLKESFNIGIEFENGFNELTTEGLIDNVQKGWSGVYSASLSEMGRKHVKDLIYKGNMLRTQILLCLIENEGQGKRTNAKKLQDISTELIKEYEYSGAGIYLELRNMIDENILEINNSELNNDSLISIKK